MEKKMISPPHVGGNYCKCLSNFYKFFMLVAKYIKQVNDKKSLPY